MSEYVIYGTNQYREKEALQKVLQEERIARDRISDIDCSGTSFNIDVLLNECSILSLFGEEEKKAVIARNPWFLKASDKAKSTGKKGKEKDSKREYLLKALTAYMKNPNPSTVLIFYLDGYEMDTRRKESKALTDAHIRTIPCESIKYWEFPKHITELLKKNKISMDPQARAEFDLRIGTDEFQLHYAIEKMKLYGESRYDLYTIQQLIPEDANLDIWKLGNAVCAGSVRDMMNAKNSMLEKGQTIQSMIPLLSSQLMRAYNVLCLSDQGYDQSSIATRLRMKESAVRMNLQRLYKRSSKDILQILMKLADLEQGMKAGTLDAAQEFDLFLFGCEVK